MVCVGESLHQMLTISAFVAILSPIVAKRGVIGQDRPGRRDRFQVQNYLRPVLELRGWDGPGQTFNPGVVGSNPTGPSTDFAYESCNSKRWGSAFCRPSSPNVRGRE